MELSAQAGPGVEKAAEQTVESVPPRGPRGRGRLENGG